MGTSNEFLVTLLETHWYEQKLWYEQSCSRISSPYIRSYLHSRRWSVSQYCSGDEIQCKYSTDSSFGMFSSCFDHVSLVKEKRCLVCFGENGPSELAFRRLKMDFFASIILLIGFTLSQASPIDNATTPVVIWHGMGKIFCCFITQIFGLPVLG